VDRAIRPERHAVGESLDIGKMQSEIAEIERGLNVNIPAIEAKAPTKRTKREHRENKSNQTKPNGPIFCQRSIIFSCDERFFRRRRHQEKKRNSPGGSDDERKKE